MERNPSSRLEEDRRTETYQGRYSRRKALRKGRTRMGIHISRSMEEKGHLGNPLEEDLENGKEADLGPVEETSLEGRMETDLEDGEEADLGSF